MPLSPHCTVIATGWLFSCANRAFREKFPVSRSSPPHAASRASESDDLLFADRASRVQISRGSITRGAASAAGRASSGSDVPREGARDGRGSLLENTRRTSPPAGSRRGHAHRVSVFSRQRVPIESRKQRGYRATRARVSEWQTMASEASRVAGGAFSLRPDRMSLSTRELGR